MSSSKKVLVFGSYTEDETSSWLKNQPLRGVEKPLENKELQFGSLNFEVGKSCADVDNKYNKPKSLDENLVGITSCSPEEDRVYTGPKSSVPQANGEENGSIHDNPSASTFINDVQVNNKIEQMEILLQTSMTERSNDTAQLKIIYIPEKEPVPPNQQPTVSVFAAIIDAKHANTIVRRLNQIAPLEHLRHVKRVKKKKLEGKIQLYVILCLANENDCQLDRMPLQVQELITSYQLSTFLTKVCKHAATTKEEWEEQCKLWPTSYHPPTFNIEGITGFSEDDSLSIFKFMLHAIKLSNSFNGLVVNTAVVVDPLLKKVIATGIDQVYDWKPTSREVVIRSLPSNGSPVKLKQLHNLVSCMHPWQWTEQASNALSSCCWHPLRHSVFVAIESSAARDRQLFPSSDDIEEKSSDFKSAESSFAVSPLKKQRILSKNVDNNNQLNSCEESSLQPPVRPYLCTGYDIFLVWEPCTMCAMALVHQRIRRIFYAFPNPNAGALGSIYRLQGEKSLNHHYAVFRVQLPKDVLHKYNFEMEGTT